MSENLKINSETGPSCLHCRVLNSKQPYQEIFDEVGVEIELADLLAKYFQINVKPDPQTPQLLCQECVKTLIRFFDIDELQREQDAATKKGTRTVTDPVSVATPVAKKEAKASVEKQTPPATKTIVESETFPLVSKKLIALADLHSAKSGFSVTPTQAISLRITKPKSQATMPKRLQITPKGKCREAVAGKGRKAREGDQEQISALIRDILDDEESPPDEKFAEAAATVRQLETEGVEEQEQEQEQEQEAIAEKLHEEQQPEPENGEELEFLVEQDDDSSESEQHQFKVVKKAYPDDSQSANETQSEDESLKVEPFNFVLIKESDGIDDLLEYLGTVVKTCFETLTFDWATVCRHCSLKCSKYENLLNHMLNRHQLPEERYKCPIDGCTAELKGHKYLAMHLVVLHAPVAEIPIYGCCPECNMTFSNILQYNKHSCAHVIKKRRGIRLYCEMCGFEFPSWKRFNFHNQFHLERHRPRACFVCNYANNNIDDLFQHLHYSHEPEGTLFCDLCDRNFRDAAVFMEHNKSHANVSSTTYTCSECSANFDTRGRLNGHMRSIHGSIIRCELCSREFATEATFNIHMKKHLIIEREVHVCNNCGMLSENHDKMLAHVDNEETPCFGVDIYVELLRDAYICEYCSAYFKQKTDLRAHRDSGVHKNGMFWCQPCEKEFADMKLYRHHLRNYQLQRADVEHRKLEICLYFMCDFEDCLESYINWNSLYTHKRRTHDTAEKMEAKTKVGEWICQFCQKVCRSKMSLSVHVARSHNNNNVVCSLCKASYKDEEALKKHHAYWHEPLECTLCLKIVKNRRNFDTHMNVVHSNNKRYKCSVCQKGFYHKSEMEAHQRLHNQLYSCEQCSFQTRNKKSLAVHVLGQHYKRFAFECKVCNKRFGRRQGLSNHMQRVHGSKYTCRDFFDGGCSKSFGSTTQLNVHVRKVHNGSILFDDDNDNVKADEEQEEQLEEEEVEADGEVEAEQVQEEKQNAAGPSTLKKRCIRINDDTQIEFIGGEEIEDEVEMLEEIQELKHERKAPPKKKQRRT